MADFEFGNIDFGQQNTDSNNYRSHILVNVGSLEVARQRFGFPGVDGEFVNNLGVRGRNNTWEVAMVAKNMSYLTAFEASVESYLAAANVQLLVERGLVRGPAYIESFSEVGSRIKLASPWSWLQKYRIVYRVLQ